MNPVIKWIKLNIFIVVFSAIIVAAPIGMWFVGGSMNESVSKEVSERANRMTDLNRIKNTSVSIINPVKGNTPINEIIVVNPDFLDRYRDMVMTVGKDAEAVHKLALEYNHKDRGVLLPELFPAPPEYERDTLPYEMHTRFIAGIEDLLVRIDAGKPPSSEEVGEDLESEKEQLENRNVADEDGEEKQKWLREKLSENRLSIYADRASSVGVYASLDSFTNLEIDQPGPVPLPSKLYEWQWQYWIYEDILLAMKNANNDSVSVLDAPVKRIVSLAVRYDPLAGASTNRGSSAGSGGFGSGRRGSSKKTNNEESTLPAANPRVEVKLDYSESFTGRHTNSLYDVRLVRLILVVETAHIPAVMDALAQRNFITVIKSEIEPVNSFDALRDGYFYGEDPVSSLELELETIWFRQWMSPFMPDDVKQALGVPLQQTPSS
ncbi:MAG: hypothetical protein IH984_16675 [Planctomycetes bacterium]|nr:hypothetical protein [Planctomycetota bacterium]